MLILIPDKNKTIFAAGFAPGYLMRKEEDISSL